MCESMQPAASKFDTRYSALGTPYSVPCTQYAARHTSTSPSPPSRNSNPFATCWTRPGALPFHFPDGSSAAQLVERLAANGWRGEIVGPHGSGKSTLLEALQPALVDAGCSFKVIKLRDGQRRLPRGIFNGDHAKLLIIDGYEQLGWLQRLLLRQNLRRPGVGLLVTSHVPTGLPTLITLAPGLPLIQQLVAALCEQSSTRITPADVVASHAGRGSNVRDVFFDLYDRHEQLRTAN
jgi:hypothetical protein